MDTLRQFFVVKKRVVTAAVMLAVIVAIGGGAYGYRQGWFDFIGQESAIPDLPSKPREVASGSTVTKDELLEKYAEARTAHDARLSDPTYEHFLSEGLAWKTVGEYAQLSEQKKYFVYAAYVYKLAQEAYPTQFVSSMNIGNIFTAMKEYSRAQEAYQQAAEIAPERGEVLIAIVEMLEAAKGKPTDEFMTYVNKRLTGLKVDGGQFVMVYARYLLENGENAEALQILLIGKDTFKDDERLPLEYASVKAELEKRGYNEHETKLN